jgi:ribonuclease, rne/rng family
MLNPSAELAVDRVLSSETILINVMPQETRVAVLEGKELCEFQVEKNIGQSIVGNIYLGQVKRVLPGMQSAFIEIGLARTAFLHFVDLVENKAPNNDNRPIETLLVDGQKLLVQVIKDPIASKGARLSSRLSLVGRHLIFLPQDDQIYISQRIENKEKREELKKLLQSILPRQVTGGYIVRTSALSASVEALKSDVHFLKKRWTELQKKCIHHDAPALIYQELSLPFRLLRDEVNENTHSIWVNCKQMATKMQKFADNYGIDLIDRIHYFNTRDKGNSLLQHYHVSEQLNKALRPHVALKGGGYLVIESTESMTTIDVNTGAFVGSHSFQQTILQANLQACAVIARQLRLRDIGGIIIVDFIDMQNIEHQKQVLAELASWLRYDKTKVTIHGLTSLGLVELTRKRTRASFRQSWLEKCSTCNGLGWVLSAQAIAYEIMFIMHEMASIRPLQKIKVVACPDVVELLLDEESKSLMHLAHELKTEVILTANNSYAREEYELYPN